MDVLYLLSQARTFVVKCVGGTGGKFMLAVFFHQSVQSHDAWHAAAFF
jgi:hypothetical protein